MRSIRRRQFTGDPGARYARMTSIRPAFTRLELLIVAVIGGLLLIGVERALLSAREHSRRQTCADHLRQLHLGLMSYHDSYETLPPAAIWRARPEDVLETLHFTDDPAAVSHQNWMHLLLPHTSAASLANRADPNAAVGAPANAVLRTSSLEWATCPSDAPHTPDNWYTAHSRAYGEVAFARGNYAINGGTQRMADFPGTTADPVPGGIHREIDADSRTVRWWGNGIAGFNRGFALAEFTNGLSTMVAVDEIRAGLHPRDPRGVWAFGQIGSSVTWAHGMNGDAGRPNAAGNRADDVAGCVELHASLGAERLAEQEMPCCSYCLNSEQAAARSRHPGGVHVLMLDGSVHMIGNNVDPGLWHVLHSRETPPGAIDAANNGVANDALTRAPHRALLGAEPAEHAMQNSIGMEFVRVPAGRFIMGLPDEELNAVFEIEGVAAAHWVEISRSFWMGAHEVTGAQYAQVMGEIPADAARAGRLPVSSISWNEAHEFCRRLGDRPVEAGAGRRYRLPTEAEWEYACRSGSQESHVYLPERQPGDVSGENALKSPPLPIVEVGRYPQNDFGLFDLRGNVWEWCADWSHPDYYRDSPERDPPGPLHGHLKVVRGSDWLYARQRCMLGHRATEPWLRSPFIGFRIVCETATVEK